MLKLENSIRGLSFSRVAFDLTIQGKKFSVGRELSLTNAKYYTTLNISFYCFYILSLIFNYNSPIRVCSLTISYNKPIVLKG